MPNLNTNETDAIAARIEEICEELTLYCDSVQIFCTKHHGADNATTQFQNGRGNYYARVGQVALWLEKEQTLNIESGEPEE